MKRKTLTILFADVQGYTIRTARQTREQNEKFIKEIRSFVEKNIQEKDGTLVKSMGDGFLITFESPTDAVACGREMQSQIKQRNTNALHHNDYIRFRIGISTGEVNVDDNGDVYGEAVNIASRIQNFASPNDVFLAEATYLAMNKSEIQALDLGPQRFKNIVQEVRVYKVSDGSPDYDTLLPAQKESSKNKTPLLTGLIILIIAAGIIAVLIKKEKPESSQSTQEQKKNIRELMQMGNYSEVISLGQKELKKNPNNAKLHLLIGEAFLQISDYNQADLYFQQAIRIDPLMPASYFKLAVVFEQTHRYEEAIQTLGEYINKETREFEKRRALKKMRVLEQKAAQREEKQLAHEQILSELERREQILREKEEKDRQEREKALEERERELEKERLRIELMKAQKQEQPAPQNTQPQQKQQPKQKESLISLMNDGDYLRLVEYGEEALEERPDNVKIRLLVGEAYFKMENYDRAIMHFKKASEVNPENPKPYQRLYVIYERKGDLFNTRKYLQEYIDHEPRNDQRELAEDKLKNLRGKMW
ncbi:MAG: adenylate/guanylate cyclase domain-containing protein [Candidatus Omnitrophota bacterium]